MNKIRKLYLQNPVLKFMISYSVVLLLPLVISMIGYQLAFNIVDKNIKETNLSMIKNSKNMIDNQIESLDALVMQIASNPTLESFADIEQTKGTGFYYDAVKVIERIDTIKRYFNIEILEDIYVYLGNTDYIITPKALYNADLFFNSILKQESTKENRQEMFLGTFKRNKCIGQGDNLECIQSIPVKFNAVPNGAIVTQIDVDKLLEFFSVEVDEGCYMYIENAEGNILASLLPEEQNIQYIDFETIKSKEGMFQQSNNIVLHTTSDINDWRYVLVLPEQVVMKELVQFKGIIYGLTLLAIIIGIGISYYLARKNGEPIYKLLGQIKDSIKEFGMDEEDDDILHLGQTVSQIVSKNQALQQELDSQQPLLETAFFQKLIHGEFNSENEINLVAQSVGVSMQGHKFIVLTYKVFPNNDIHNIDTQTLKEVRVASILIKQILEETLEHKTYFYGIDYLTQVAIIEAEGSGNKIVDTLYKVNKRISEEYHITPAWGISVECDELLEIWRAYEQAKKALFTATKQENRNIVSYSNVVEDKSQYYYSLPFEQKLITYTQTADIASIQHLLEVLYTENFVKRDLAKETIDELYSEIKSTIIKLTQPHTHQSYTEEIEQYMIAEDEKDVVIYFEKLYELFKVVSNEYKKNKTQNQTKLSNKIIEYIQEVYMDPNLGLAMIANKFNISEGYVSSLFKEQTGINFTEYVENLRIGKACEKLLETSININDIGEQVGYNSVQSFRRAFKRIQGISPSEFRKQKK